MDSKTVTKVNETELKCMESLKDVKSIDEIDLDKLVLIRGKTPDNIKDKCLKLCKEYLAGNWKQQTIDSIEFRRVSGGLTNQLYYCGISTPSNTPSPSTNVPQEVAIRFYGEKYFNKFDAESKERLTDVVIAILVSESQLGPKICGIFEEGQIQRFYKHRQFKLEEQQDNELVTELFQKLARVHAMDVPIKKCHWLFREMDNFYEKVEQNLAKGANELIKELNAETLLQHSLKNELIWMKDLIVKSKSPMTFTHNDFRSSNIMILDDNNNNDERTDRIVLCDFEYSSYGYRGHDFGTIICEWGRSPNDFKDTEKFPEDSTIRSLIDIYVKELEKILGKTYSENKLNSVEQIFKEVKVFALSQTLFIVIWCLIDNEEIKEVFPIDTKVQIQMAETMFKTYMHLKQKFIQQNSFDF